MGVLIIGTVLFWAIIIRSYESHYFKSDQNDLSMPGEIERSNIQVLCPIPELFTDPRDNPESMCNLRDRTVRCPEGQFCISRRTDDGMNVISECVMRE